MPQETNQIAINDLLGHPPGWLLRSGITLVFIVVLGVLLLSALIHYPDELTGKAIIQHQQAPINLSFPNTAQLDTLFVEDGAEVQFGQQLGILKSEADWKEVLLLDSILKTANTIDRTSPELNHLGSMQSTYAKWISIRNTFLHHEEDGGLEQQLRALSREIAHTRELEATTRKQIELLNQQIALETSDYYRQEKLLADKVISAKEMEEKKKAWLAIQEKKILLEANLIQHHLKKDQLKQTQLDLRRRDKDESFDLEQSNNKLTEELTGQLQAWKERYLLIAPASGVLILNEEIVEKQMVTAGASLGSIQPFFAKETPLQANVRIPATGLGKIGLGDKVLIRLDAYPEKEFGVLYSKVHRISALPKEDEAGTAFYFMEAELEEPLVTNFGHTLPPGITMLGTGTIITKEKSVLERIFEQLFSIVRQDV